MTDIETLLREAAQSGLKGLTLYPCASGWQANTTRDGQGWRCCTNADPVAALREALAGRRPPEASIFE